MRHALNRDRRTSRRARWMLAALVLGLTGGGAAAGRGAERVDAVGRPVLLGLRADITGVTTGAPGMLAVGYRLRWVGPHQSWILGPSAPVNVVFWMASKRRVFGDFQTIPLDSAFVAGTTTEATYQIIAKAPPGATAVSLMFGTSGLETAAQTLR